MNIIFLYQFIAHAAGQNTVNELFTHLYKKKLYPNPNINIDEMAEKMAEHIKQKNKYIWNKIKTSTLPDLKEWEDWIEWDDKKLDDEASRYVSIFIQNNDTIEEAFKDFQKGKMIMIVISNFSGEETVKDFLDRLYTIPPPSALAHHTPPPSAFSSLYVFYVATIVIVVGGIGIGKFIWNKKIKKTKEIKRGQSKQ